MQNQKISPEGAYQTFMVIWIALFVSQLFFAGFAFFLRPGLLKFDLTKPLLGENAVMVLAFAVISIADIAFSFVLRKKFLDQSVADQNIGLVQTAMIAGCALSEVISMLGLFLAVSFNYQYFFLFSALGVIAMVLHLPRRSDIAAANFRV